MTCFDGNELVALRPQRDHRRARRDDYRIPLQAIRRPTGRTRSTTPNTEKGPEPFREFTTIFHDEIAAHAGVPGSSETRVPRMRWPASSDVFAINYGIGGIGAEISPTASASARCSDCAECKFEEFFLSSLGGRRPGDDRRRAGEPGEPGRLDHRPGAGHQGALPGRPVERPPQLHQRPVKFRILHAGEGTPRLPPAHPPVAVQPRTTTRLELPRQPDDRPGRAATPTRSPTAARATATRPPATRSSTATSTRTSPRACGRSGAVTTSSRRGTALDADGRPRARARRALPDGEIAAGTPIPAVVPLPGAGDGADAGAVQHRAARRQRRRHGSSQVAGRWAPADWPTATARPTRTPAIPFFIPGVAGHRPPTRRSTSPKPTARASRRRRPAAGTSSSAASAPRSRLRDADSTSTKESSKTSPRAYIPEDGTAAEHVAMAFHASVAPELPDRRHRGQRRHARSSRPTAAGRSRATRPHDPCRRRRRAVRGPVPRRRDPGTRQVEPVNRHARSTRPPTSRSTWCSTRTAGTSRSSASLTLWEDVGADRSTARGRRSRSCSALNTRRLSSSSGTPTSCPTYYELDDFQVRTPTDVIGQHIHLVKFDVTSSDGSANGFNYEDGTFSPHEVRDASTRSAPQRLPRRRRDRTADRTPGPACPLAREHPFFGQRGRSRATWRGVPGRRSSAGTPTRCSTRRGTSGLGTSSRTTTSARRPTSRSASTRPC